MYVLEHVAWLGIQDTPASLANALISEDLSDSGLYLVPI